jgi:hypothetical protein
MGWGNAWGKAWGPAWGDPIPILGTGGAPDYWLLDKERDETDIINIMVIVTRLLSDGSIE